MDANAGKSLQRDLVCTPHSWCQQKNEVPPARCSMSSPRGTRSMTMSKMSRTMPRVVSRTRMAKTKVQRGSAIFHSGLTQIRMAACSRPLQGVRWTQSDPEQKLGPPMLHSDLTQIWGAYCRTEPPQTTLTGAAQPAAKQTTACSRQRLLCCSRGLSALARANPCQGTHTRCRQVAASDDAMGCPDDPAPE